MMEEPKKPDESDCCGSGCKPCVFDIYREQLVKWKSGTLKDVSRSCLSELHFSPFIITSVDPVADTLKIIKFQSITLKVQDSSKYFLTDLSPGCDYDDREAPAIINGGQYLILRGIHEGSVISRSYTPIIDENELKTGMFTVAISFLEKGKMSNFLSERKVGDVLFWRGPYKEFQYNKNSFKHLLMFGGGTGIVPLFNIAKSIVENDEEETRITLWASFKTSRHFLLRKELNRLTDYWNFTFRTFITGESRNEFRFRYNESISFGRIDETDLMEELSKYSVDEVFVLISGPESFIKIIESYLLKQGVQSNNIFSFLYIWVSVFHSL